MKQASVQRCIASVSFENDKFIFFPATINSDQLHQHFLKVAGEMIGPQNVQNRQPVMGSEDFAFYSKVVPLAYYYFLGMKGNSSAPAQPAHSPYYTINEQVLPYGAALHASLAFSYLKKTSSISISSSTSTTMVHDEF